MGQSSQPGRTIASAADAHRFALAGHAVLTLKSRKTGTRYTYRVDAPKVDPEAPRPHHRFVSVLTGPDNTSDYAYIGLINNSAGPTFRLTHKSRLTDASLPVRAFRYFCERVLAHPDAPIPPDLEVRHEGRCGACGRMLTVPESIDRGIGPECAAKLGVS